MNEHRSELGASLDHLCIRSPDPERMARFFEEAFGMQKSAMPGGPWRCMAPEREVLIDAGPPHSVGFYAFGFESEDALARYRRTLGERGVALQPNRSPLFDAGAFSTVDPDGNVGVFGVRRSPSQASQEGLPARLQHVVVRTPNLEAMVRFYEQDLGFVVSDKVRDASELLHACFLRSDAEHHSIAMFRSTEARLDHHSYETGDWNDIRHWADRMAARRIPIVWGVGRHGPGNDLFFMVRDPDENLVEISAEIEVCAADRPQGLWVHEQRTLNLWGNAIMRS